MCIKVLNLIFKTIQVDILYWQKQEEYSNNLLWSNFGIKYSYSTDTWWCKSKDKAAICV